MVAELYHVPEATRLTATVRDTTGTLVDPATVVLTIERPDGTQIIPNVATLVHDSTGVYVFDYQNTVAGRHTASWVITDPDDEWDVEWDVEGTLLDTVPPQPRTYATPAQYRQVTGEAPPADALRRLARATRFVDRLLLTAIYETDTTDSMPLDVNVTAALMEAVCWQVHWQAQTGDEFGLSTIYPTMSIGSVSISRGQGGGTGSAWERAAPLAVDALLNAVTVDGLPLFLGSPIILG